MMRTFAVIAGLLASSLVVACGAPPNPRTGAIPVAADTKNPVVPKDFDLEGVVRAARADAARVTGQPADSLVLISAESVTWPDSSIGCPVPGMLYTQALVPGFRVRLRGPGGEMDYHAAERGGLVLCDVKRAGKPLPPGGGYDSKI